MKSLRFCRKQDVREIVKDTSGATYADKHSCLIFRPKKDPVGQVRCRRM